MKKEEGEGGKGSFHERGLFSSGVPTIGNGPNIHSESYLDGRRNPWEKSQPSWEEGMSRWLGEKAFDGSVNYHNQTKYIGPHESKS